MSNNQINLSAVAMIVLAALALAEQYRHNRWLERRTTNQEGGSNG